MSVLKVQTKVLMMACDHPSHEAITHPHCLLFLLLFFGGTGSHYVTQAGLELMILLIQTPECWDSRSGPPCLATVSASEGVLYASPLYQFSQDDFCVIKCVIVQGSRPHSMKDSRLCLP